MDFWDTLYMYGFFLRSWCWKDSIIPFKIEGEWYIERPGGLESKWILQYGDETFSFLTEGTSSPCVTFKPEKVLRGQIQFELYSKKGFWVREIDERVTFKYALLFNLW